MCPGGSVLYLLAGFWRENDDSDLIIECKLVPENCLGK